MIQTTYFFELHEYGDLASQNEMKLNKTKP